MDENEQDLSSFMEKLHKNPTNTENAPTQFDCVSKDKKQMVSFDESVQMIQDYDSINQVTVYYVVGLAHNFIEEEKIPKCESLEKMFFKKKTKDKMQDEQLKQALEASMQTVGTKSKIGRARSKSRFVIKFDRRRTRTVAESYSTFDDGDFDGRFEERGHFG